MTLTETADLTKKGLIVLGLFIFLSITAWAGYQWYYYNVYLPSIPKEEPKPDNKFGVLPKLVLNDPESSLSSTGSYTYTVDTQTGDVPQNTPKILKVFFIPQLYTTLLAPDNSKKLANLLNFPNGPELITATQYKFTDNNNGEFLINLNTGNFNYAHRLYSTDSAEYKALGIKPEEDTISDKNKVSGDFKRFLSSKGLLKEQLNGGKINVDYDTPNPIDSTHALVSMWQADVDSLPVITTKYDSGLINGIVTKFKDESQKFLILDYTYWPVDTSTFGTYYIKTAQTAFTDLRAGNGTVLIPPTKTPVSITNIYLAYILGNQYNAYLQPVYVFEGSQNAPFAAIVPAVTSDNIQK